MHSVVLDSVHKIYRRTGFLFTRRRTETYALRGITLNVSRGEVLALLGPNGSGKSTTLKLISTVLLPDRGSVLINGANTVSDPQRVREHVGFALASERSFYPRLTVRENLEFFAALENISKSARHERVTTVLHEVGMEANAQKQVMKLSSGMHQRLGIARALIKNPRVLLLDEPTRSLDPAGAEHLWTLVRRLAARGITILLATHSFTEAVSASDRVATLQSGELLGTRSTANISADQLRHWYLQLTDRQDLLPWPAEVPA